MEGLTLSTLNYPLDLGGLQGGRQLFSTSFMQGKEMAHLALAINPLPTNDAHVSS